MYIGFTPNESVDWGLMVVLYTFLSALSQGGITVALLSFVFGRKALEPLAGFSLLSAFGLLVVSPLLLLLHLGKPLRSYLIFVLPNLHSPLALFSFSFLLHVLLLAVILWLLARKDAGNLIPGSGLGAVLWRPFRILVPRERTPEAARFEDRALKVVLVADFCVALVFHGYVGYLFGSFSWHPWWSSLLMPFLFVISSETAGLALVALLFLLATRSRSLEGVSEVSRVLGRSILLALLLETGLETARLHLLFMGADAQVQGVSALLTGPLFVPYIFVQVLPGLLALVVLIPISLGSGPGRSRPRWLLFLASLSVILHVFAMRWNVVIGGQLVSRNLAGIRSYVHSWTGNEGLILSFLMLLLPMGFAAILFKMFAPWSPRRVLMEIPAVSGNSPPRGEILNKQKGGDR
ncbi:MAG: NrfD/PsrC family molybdoenzyme membrane anchor subunit [Planctomycetota bacterium]|jgi:Ni/Fe-hydrogenase subunit HybB-like protein